MKKNKHAHETSGSRQRTPISRAKTYEEMSAFWDEHDFTEFPEHYRELTEPVEVDICRVDHYVKLEPKTLQRARRIARQRGISTEKLINQWVREAVSRT